MKPTIIYVKPLLKIIQSINLKALAHITGGGIAENLSRVLPNKLGAMLSMKELDFEKNNSIYKWLNHECRLNLNEMLKTFNCGIGMIIVVSKKDLEQTIDICKAMKQQVKYLGKITNSQKEIVFY